MNKTDFERASELSRADPKRADKSEHKGKAEAI